jgi:Reverse transcriptase (RNA-dependent DNA polymerase)
MVLVPKPLYQGYHGIALLETLYKLVSMLIHGRLNTTIGLHESIHGLQTQRETGTAIMHVKLLMQQVQRDSDPMYLIFLDLKNANDTIDCSQILQMLQKYGVGPNMLQIIENIWAHDTIIPKQFLVKRSRRKEESDKGTSCPQHCAGRCFAGIQQ